jgi:hypothetical protein
MKTKKIVLAILVIALAFGLIVAGCSSGGGGSGKEFPNELTIKNEGDGAVTTKIAEGADGYETEVLKIEQVIPAFGISSPDLSISMISEDMGRAASPPSSYMGDNYWPADLPITIIFNDVIFLNSIKNNFDIFVGSKQVYGNIIISSSPYMDTGKPRAILTFTPYKPFDIGKNVNIIISTGMEDKCGNQLNIGITISFIVEKPADSDAFLSSNWGFEEGFAGVQFKGDGNILNGGTLNKAHGGENYAAISTGNMKSNGKSLLSDTPSIGNQSSFLTLGPINNKFTNISLWYNFISAEFNEYVGTKYNDEAVITIYGPNGTASKSLTSVNTLGKQEKNADSLIELPAMQTGWRQFTLDINDVGTPAYIIFTVSDVGDNIFSSILAVDDIDLK